MMTRRRTTAALLSTVVVTATLAFALFGTSAHAVACSTSNVLSGSSFEIDTNANLKVDGASPCIDWLAGGTSSALRSDVLAKSDKPTGTGDDSFGKGTAEDNANPTIVDGSIPPNKSDLKIFGVHTESATGKFLQLFWSRVQNPSGTTNMDFELNQKFCDLAATPTNCANNGSDFPAETPLRTIGDKLITYDLSKGGTVPTISIRTWGGSAWGTATVLTGTGTAIGSVNTSDMAAADTGTLGSQSAFTFGEASIAFTALFPAGTACGTFGSAYLKSRSSDSFTSEIKDFIAPERVQISNCTTISTSASASVTLGSPISDTATLANATATAGGTITFHLYSTATCTAASEINTGLSAVTVNGNGNYNSGNYTPTTVGTYYWIASYSGDQNNSAATGTCGDTGESSVVTLPTSSIATTQSIYPQDSATISATAGGTPTGNVTFKLFGPDNTTCDASGAAAVFSQVVALNGSGVAATTNSTFSVSTASSSVYRWLVTYPGDATHSGTTSACGTEQFTLSITNG
jgi:hypothetical protein